LATTLTTTVLPQLDGARKGVVLRFLVNARLIDYQPFGPGAKVTLRGADLQGVRAPGLAIGGADLTGADLRHADLRGAAIGVADTSSVHDCVSGVSRGFCGSIRSSTPPRSARLEEVLLSDADLSHAEIAAATFDGSDLRRADLREALIFEVSMNSTCLTGAEFVRTSLERVSFKYAEGSGVDFSGAELNLVNFGRRDAIAQLADVALKGARVFPARLPAEWDAHAPDAAGRLTGSGGVALGDARKRRLCSGGGGSR
jgi:uncharacterized protein YjbI with pentapeptide repeats